MIRLMNHHKSEILAFLKEHSSIFTREFFRERINGEKITINSLYYVLFCNDFYMFLNNKTDSIDINELLYIMFFISKLRSHFHFSHTPMELINIKLVQIENMLFNLLLENDTYLGIDIDEIINITNTLSTSVKFSDIETFNKKSYKQSYTKFCCICIKIVPISTNVICP